MDKENSQIISNILNIVSILVALSFLLYFFGLIYLSAYYKSFNLSVSLFNFDYDYYVVTGIIILLPIVIPLHILITRKVDNLLRLKKLKARCEKGLKELSELKVKQLAVKDNSLTIEALDKEISNAKGIAADIKATEEDVLKSWNSQDESRHFLIVLLIVIFLFYSAAFYFNEYVLMVMAIEVTVVFLIGKLVSKHIKHFLQSKTTRIISITVMFFYFFLFFCFISYAEGWLESRVNDLEKVTVKDLTGEYEAEYIVVGKESYFFKVNDKVISIPKESISLIIWK